MVCLCEDLLSVGTYQMLWHQIGYTYVCNTYKECWESLLYVLHIYSIVLCFLCH